MVKAKSSGKPAVSTPSKAKASGKPAVPTPSKAKASGKPAVTTPPKAKAAGGHPVSSLPKALDSHLTKALALVEAKKYAEAEAIFESLVGSAKELGNLGLQRMVQNYLSVCHEHTTKASKGHISPEAEAQMLLNRGDAKAALTLLDKALKASPNHAAQHYLKASAHAQLGDAEASAEALNHALLLDGDLLNLYRLEPDFEKVRNLAPFAAIERT